MRIYRISLTAILLLSFLALAFSPRNQPTVPLSPLPTFPTVILPPLIVLPVSVSVMAPRLP